MKTFPIKLKDGHLYAFEIDNTDIWPRRISKLLNTLDGVTKIQRKKLLRRLDKDHSEDTVHIKFSYNNKEFVVLEPWGDSSRYWIGPKDSNDIETGIIEIESVFQKHKIPLVRRIMVWLVFSALLILIFWEGIGCKL